jgi:hypothetical protein
MTSENIRLRKAVRLLQPQNPCPEGHAAPTLCQDAARARQERARATIHAPSLCRTMLAAGLAAGLRAMLEALRRVMGRRGPDVAR